MKLVLSEDYPNTPPKGISLLSSLPCHHYPVITILSSLPCHHYPAYPFIIIMITIGYFLTKIYHPNVAPNGDICVNTLKKDWTADTTLKVTIITTTLWSLFLFLSLLSIKACFTSYKMSSYCSIS